MLCGAGGSLFLKEDHCLKFKVGLGTGSNKFFELMALRLNLLFALEKGVLRLQIFGDSQLVIHWMRKESIMRNF
jgi:ribonuclease HI